MEIRSEEKVLEQVLNFAEKDERIRMVLFNGSRVNDEVENDIFSDYDFMFLVNDPKDFLSNKRWMEQFGEIIITQCYDFSTTERERYIFLTLFKDYIRIDIQIFCITQVGYCIQKSSLTVLLLDKDKLCKRLPYSNAKSHYVKKPSEKEFIEVVENFWWFTTCAAKGIWRRELPYVKFNFDFICHHECLIKLLSWYVGVNNEWNVNVGKNGKWLEKYLPTEIWKMYIKLFVSSDYQDIWQAIFNAYKLVDKIGKHISKKLDYSYPSKVALDVTNYLRMVRELPENAVEFKAKQK